MKSALLITDFIKIDMSLIRLSVIFQEIRALFSLSKMIQLFPCTNYLNAKSLTPNKDVQKVKAETLYICLELRWKVAMQFWKLPRKNRLLISSQPFMF